MGFLGAMGNGRPAATGVLTILAVFLGMLGRLRGLGEMLLREGGGQADLATTGSFAKWGLKGRFLGRRK
jgi:hypothetical protein